jgi:hypothetical protein
MTESQDERRGEVCAGPAQLNRQLLDERLGLPSASRWRRYERCAGSWQLEQEARKLGQEAHTGSPEAQRGELIHAWLAGIPGEDGKEIVLSESEAQTAEFLLERMTDQRIRIFGEEPVQQLVEKRLWLTLNGKKVLSGRFDRCIYTSFVALVQDAKTGWAEPDPAEQNAQLMVLAVLVALHMLAIGLPLREVIVQIVSGPYGVTEARYDRAALKEAWDRIVATLRKLNDPKASLVAGITQCKWCPAQLICPANRDLLMITKPLISKLPETPREAGRILDEIAVLRMFFDEAEAFYKKRLNDDPTFRITHYELVPNAPRREITDVEKARLKLSEYLDEAELNRASKLTLGEIEDMLGKKLGVHGKDLKAKSNMILQGLVTEKTPKPSLKRTSNEPILTREALNEPLALSDKKGGKIVEVILP